MKNILIVLASTGLLAAIGLFGATGIVRKYRITHRETTSFTGRAPTGLNENDGLHRLIDDAASISQSLDDLNVRQTYAFIGAGAGAVLGLGAGVGLCMVLDRRKRRAAPVVL